jgi:hypothetical protein
MEAIKHKFTDSLSKFLIEHPTANHLEWLEQLDHNELSQLIRFSTIIVNTQVTIQNATEFLDHVSINDTSDIHLLAFKVNNIGKKRKISKIEPARRINLINKIAMDAQITLISKCKIN